MKTICLALRSAFELAWKLGAVLTATALLTSMFQGEDDAAVGSSAGASREEPTSAGERTYLTMKTAEGGCCSNCSLLDEDGSELLRVSYDRRGYMHLAWGERFSAAPSLITTTDGGLGLNFKMNGLLYNLSRRPDGAMNFDLFGLSDGERRAFRITAAGEVVPISLDVAR